jgi:hypothetical protein
VQRLTLEQKKNAYGGGGGLSDIQSGVGTGGVKSKERGNNAGRGCKVKSIGTGDEGLQSSDNGHHEAQACREIGGPLSAHLRRRGFHLDRTRVLFRD